MLISNNGDLDKWTFSYVVDEKGQFSGEVRLRNPTNPGFYYSLPLEEALGLRFSPTGRTAEGNIQSEYDNIRRPDWTRPGANIEGSGVAYWNRM